MSVDFSKLSVKDTIGGSDYDYEDDFLFSQSQHVVSDKDKYFVSMLLNRNFRMVNKGDKSVKDAEIDGFSVGLAAGMSLHGNDELLVVDNNNGNVVVCDRATGSCKNGEFITGLSNPNSVTKDKNGHIYVSSVGDGGPGVKMFGPDGSQIKVVTNECANYVTYDHTGHRIIVTDTDNNKVLVYSIETGNVFKLQLTITNGLAGPQGTAVDKDGNIFVCDSGESRVQVFDKDGKFLAFLGGDVEDLFTYPMDAFMSEESVLVVVDGSVMSGWSRLQTFQC